MSKMKTNVSPLGAALDDVDKHSGTNYKSQCRRANMLTALMPHRDGFEVKASYHVYDRKQISFSSLQYSLICLLNLDLTILNWDCSE